MTSADEIQQAEQEYMTASAEEARLQERCKQLGCLDESPVGDGEGQARTAEQDAALKEFREAEKAATAAFGKLAKARGFNIG